MDRGTFFKAEGEGVAAFWAYPPFKHFFQGWDKALMRQVTLRLSRLGRRAACAF